MNIKTVAIFKKTLLMLIAILLLSALAIAGFIIYELIAAKAYERLAKNAVLKPVKVFQIGFSKCGTVSLAHFFNRNGIPAVHHDFGNLATSISQNARKGLPLIAPQYSEYVVYTDMENWFDNPPLNIATDYFKELDQQYPGSKFILNTRDKAAWLRSRSQHPVYGKKQVETLLNYTAATLQISKEQVLDIWSKEWDQHHQAVLDYFKDRPQDLLVFNIDTDGPQQLIGFFKDNFVLKAKHYQHKNKTPKEFKTSVQDPLNSKMLFAKSYKLNNSSQNKTMRPNLIERYNARHIAKVQPLLDTLLQQAANTVAAKGIFPQQAELDFSKALHVNASPQLYNFRFWSSNPALATKTLKQTAYLQANLNGHALGLTPGHGGLITCLMANRSSSVDVECYYQVKEM